MGRLCRRPGARAQPGQCSISIGGGIACFSNTQAIIFAAIEALLAVWVVSLIVTYRSLLSRPLGACALCWARLFWVSGVLMELSDAGELPFLVIFRAFLVVLEFDNSYV